MANVTEDEQRELLKDELYDQLIQQTEKLSVEELRQLVNLALNFKQIKRLLVEYDE